MISFQIEDKRDALALEELFLELPQSSFPDVAVTCKRGKAGFDACRNGKTGEIAYGDRRSLLRAATFFAMKPESEWTLAQTPAFSTLAAMPDASRNAVPTIQTLKKFFRLLAMEGYSAVMLYAEDTYELKNYPYFGHLRGRYTEEELRELDDYADRLGLELIPAVQTLAHLNAFFEWPASEKYHDCNDILLTGDEGVYTLLSEMLAVWKRNLRSRRINVGFDEALMLGCGQYRDKNGTKPREEIMQAHLLRVLDLCREAGFDAYMWSDMYFRMNNRGVYRVRGANLPPETVQKVPDGVTLVYWDYYQPDSSMLDEMFRQHRVFPNKVAFAGGDSSWYGPIPLNEYAKTCVKAAAKSLKTNRVEEVFVTMWKDDGAACSLFSTLSTLFGYAEICWSSQKETAARLLALTGLKESQLLNFESLYRLPTRKKYGKERSNPGRYIFYENLLTGKFDCHIPNGSEKVMRDAARRFKRFEKEAPEGWKYLFETVAVFADATAEKAELARQIYTTYHQNDKQTMQKLCQRIALAQRKAERFRRTLRAQWMAENKSFGFDVMDVRIGGLEAQMDTAKTMLEEWISGKREKIEELEAPRLPYGAEGEKGYDNGVLLLNRWERMAGQNLSNMF